jgi:arabinogalactan oligomer/maltooligosaccharide transport system permease protein
MSITTDDKSTEQAPPLTSRQKRAARIADAASVGLWPIVAKIAMVGLVDAIAVYALVVLVPQGQWLMAGAVAVIAAIVNWVYLSRKKLPAKYLTPGLIFLAIFQVFVIFYTGYIAMTNSGTGHNGSQEQAVASLMSSALERVEDSPTYPVTIVEGIDGLNMLVTSPEGDALLGTFEEGQAVATDGYTTLSFQQVISRTGEIEDLIVPVSEDPNDGALRTPDGSNAYQYVSSLEYDEAAGTVTDLNTGTVYTDIGTGAFTAENGEELLPGWQIFVGFDNYVRAFTEQSIRGPLVYVTLWTFAFAIISVAATFFLGLFLAIVFNDSRMRGRRWYRTGMILPFAFPAFLSALIWQGMMNQSFGFLNQVLFGGASIPWLTDPTLAKFSVLLLNLWLGFPYMFLICLGALQSIPEELTEAATVDGARPWAVFRLIKLPLLLVTVAPLLIASFAFNFNNFIPIYALTNGGPRDINAPIPVGHTDILITMVYKVAFTGQNRDYGLASAFSILIFIIVAVIAIVLFRRTKALEDLN